MRAGEGTTRRHIRRLYHQEFLDGDRRLLAVHEFHGLLCDKNFPGSQKCPQTVIVGLWAKICRQYRSILVLCEIGLTQDAEVIVRCLFESTVQLLFVTKRNIRLPGRWKNAPKIPRTRFSMEFRARLYLARDLLNEQKRLNVWKKTQGLKRMARRLAASVNEMVHTAEELIGHEWMQWLEKTPLSVESMAKNVGLSRWYEAVYRLQSPIAHANDALSHVQPDDMQMTVDASIEPDWQGAMEPLRLANELIRLAGGSVSARFGLEFNKHLV